MSNHLTKLRSKYHYSAILLRELVITDFKLRYQGSVLGYLWSLLRPLALFLILYIVFVEFLRIGDGVPHFPVYLLLGIVIWSYFSEVTNTSVTAIVDKGDLMRKINFPKYIIVLAGSFSALINLCLNFVVIIGFMIISGVEVSKEVVFLPLLIGELFVLSLGVAFLLSAVFVKFRDVNYIWEVVMQGAFYATPILYPITMIPLLAAQLLILNPVAQIIQDMRYVLITDQSATVGSLYDSWVYYLIPVSITIATALIGAMYFRKRSKYFAEEV